MAGRLTPTQREKILTLLPQRLPLERIAEEAGSTVKTVRALAKKHYGYEPGRIHQAVVSRQTKLSTHTKPVTGHKTPDEMVKVYAKRIRGGQVLFHPRDCVAIPND